MIKGRNGWGLLSFFGHVISCSWQSISRKKKFWWQNGVEVGIHAKYVPICVVKPIEVDAKSENGSMTQT